MRGADRARDDLAETLDLLKDNLVPRRLAGEAAAATRAHSPDWLVRFWDTARSPAGLGLIGATAASIALGVSRKRRRGMRG